MNTKAALWTAALALAAGAGPAQAQSQPPIAVSALPHIVIFSPAFYWQNTPDVVRMASATCPKGRAVGGGLSIVQGSASLRIADSYPDGASWVTRFAVRPTQTAPPAQTLQVRGFALCLLPVSRDHSVQFARYPKLMHASNRIALAPGGVSTTGRQACPQGTLVVSGGIGLDPPGQDSAWLRMELSFPDPYGWNIRAVNDADAGQTPAQVRVHGVCISTTEGLDIANRQTVYFAEADVTVKPGQKVIRQTVACKSSQDYALAGGFKMTRGRNAVLELHESYPDTPSSWTVALSNVGGKKAGDARVRLYTACIGK
jgi:hypothetical protein